MSLLVLLAYCKELSAQVDEQTELRRLVESGHRNAVDSIQTLSANYIYTTSKPIISTASKGWYRRSQDQIRVQEGKEGTATSDYLIRDGEIRQVGRKWSKQNQASYIVGRRTSAEMFGLCDIWMGVLLTIPGPQGHPVPASAIYQRSISTPQFARELLDGRPCIRGKCTFKSVASMEMCLTIWHDVRANYLIRKITWQSADHPDSFLEAEILEFAEPHDNVLVPTRCRRREYTNSNMNSESQIALTDLHVNRPLPTNTWALPSIPPGTVMRDQIQGTRYTVDSNWRQMGPSTPAPRISTVGALPVQEPSEREQTSSEPLPVSFWIVYSAIGLIIVAGLVALARWFRERSRTTKPTQSHT